MNFIVSSSSLLKKIQIVSGVISTSNTIPILDHILFEVNQNKLILTASDLETTYSSEIEIKSEEAASIAIPGKILLDALKTFADQPLTFKTKEENLIEIISEQGNYSFPILDGNDFPKPADLDEVSEFNIPGYVLANAINKTLFAVSNDDLKAVMTGVFFETTAEGINFVATDAHRLVKYSRKDIIPSAEGQFIVPKKPLSSLKNILVDVEEDVKVSYNASNANFKFSEYELNCRLIEGVYPKYSAVIPVNNEHELIVSRTSLLNSVRRISIFSNKTTHQVRFEIKGNELNISAEDVDYSNKANERMSCNYNGDDMNIGFNARFLNDILGTIETEEVMFKISTPAKASLIVPTEASEEGEELITLIMPVVLNN